MRARFLRRLEWWRRAPSSIGGGGGAAPPQAAVAGALSAPWTAVRLAWTCRLCRSSAQAHLPSFPPALLASSAGGGAAPSLGGGGSCFFSLSGRRRLLARRRRRRLFRWRRRLLGGNRLTGRCATGRRRRRDFLARRQRGRQRLAGGGVVAWLAFLGCLTRGGLGFSFSCRFLDLRRNEHLSVAASPPACSFVWLSLATSSIFFGFGGATSLGFSSAAGWKISTASASTLLPLSDHSAAVNPAGDHFLLRLLLDVVHSEVVVDDHIVDVNRHIAQRLGALDDRPGSISVPHDALRKVIGLKFVRGYDLPVIVRHRGIAVTLMLTPSSGRRQRCPGEIVVRGAPGHPCRRPATTRDPEPSDLLGEAPATVMVRGPAKRFIGDPRPATVGVDPATPRVGAPGLIDARWYPDILPLQPGPIAIRRKRS